jgi:hypothetical protein
MNIATIMNRTVAQAKRTGENKTAKIPIIVVVTLEDGILIPEITPVLAYITNPEALIATTPAVYENYPLRPPKLQETDWQTKHRAESSCKK